MHIPITIQTILLQYFVLRIYFIRIMCPSDFDIAMLLFNCFFERETASSGLLSANNIPEAFSGKVLGTCLPPVAITQ